MVTFTVTEALVKLKLVGKKITDGTNAVLVGYVSPKGSNAVWGGYKSQQEFKDESKSRIDSVKGLISFRDKLKKAIVESNARTSVVVGNKTMTVAEAVEAKSSIAFKKALLQKLVGELTTLEARANQANVGLEARADQFITQSFQNIVVGEDQKKEARKTFVENNTNVVIIYDRLKETIKSLKDEIDDFETNVDVALSVVNAKTEINVQE